MHGCKCLSYKSMSCSHSVMSRSSSLSCSIFPPPPFMTQSAVSGSGHVQTGAKSVLVKKGRIVTVTQRFVAQSFNVGRRLVDVQEPVMAGVRCKKRAVEGWGGGKGLPSQNLCRTCWHTYRRAIRSIHSLSRRLNEQTLPFLIPSFASCFPSHHSLSPSIYFSTAHD